MWRAILVIAALFVASVRSLSIGSTAYVRSHSRSLSGLGTRSALSRVSTRLSFRTFDEMLVELETPVLVDFYAEWCGPCKMMVPVLEEIASRMENDIKVAKVDTDKSPGLGHRYQVEALPTLILFSKGQVVERYVGYMSADDLQRAVTKTLKTIQ